VRDWLIGASLLLAACATPDTQLVACPAAGCPSPENPINAEMRARAEFDLQCRSDQLQVIDLDSRRSLVRGCGREARYYWSGRAWLDSPVMITNR
jgi:hypothetical protein